MSERAVQPLLVELLTFLVAQVVSRPQAVRVSRVETPKTDLFYLTVAPEDLGRLLGREGKTVEAIRVLVELAAARQGKDAVVDVIEPDRPREPRSRPRRRRGGRRRKR